MKHIEQIQPEYAADDMTALLLSDATASAALSRLLHDWTGCAIPPTADTPQSEVEELVPLCLSILRRHWTTPLTALGDGNTPLSLADLLRRLIGDRVQGNEALGILPANADILAAVAALRQRDISSGLTLSDGTDGSTDGLSLAQLLCSSDVASKVTEIVDSNKGWIMTQSYTQLTNWKNLEKLELGCAAISHTTEVNKTYMTMPLLKELHCPNLESITDLSQYSSYNSQFCFSVLERINLPKLKSATGCLFEGGALPEEVELPELVTATRGLLERVAGVKRILAPKLTTCNDYSYRPNLLTNCPDLEYAYIPNLSAYTVYRSGDGAGSLQDMPKLSHLVIGKAPFTSNSTFVRFALDGCPNLVLLDIRGGLSQNIYLDNWNPTTALAERLPEFLSNFQTYIADRVADRTGKTALTLTLSAAVYEALQAQEGQTILATLTNKNWTVAQA